LTHTRHTTTQWSGDEEEEEEEEMFKDLFCPKRLI
jgi:hypothetical protein